MIALKITDIKNFMGRLLIKEDFDHFLAEKAEVMTSYEMSLSGRRNIEWYDSDVLQEMEQESMKDVVWMTWAEMKSVIYEFIKGKQTPSYMRLAFRLSEKQAEEFLVESGMKSLYQEQKPEFLFQIRYERGELVVVTGISFSQFVLDKSLERIWDESLESFLEKKGISLQNST